MRKEPIDHSDRWVIPPDEAGSKLGCSPRTIRRMMADGRLPCVEIGHRKKIPVEGLRRWLEEQTRAT